VEHPLTSVSERCDSCWLCGLPTQ